MLDTTDHILNELAVLRAAAAHRGDEAEMRRVDQDIEETRELLGRPAVPVLHGAWPGSYIITS